MKKTACMWLAVLLLLSACTGSAATWQEQYDLGVRYLSQGNYEEAILAFQAAIEIDPKKADAYLGLADAYEAMGDAEQARRVLEDALAVVADTGAVRSRLDALEGSVAPEPTSEPTPEPADEPDEESGFVYLLTRQSFYRANGAMILECLYQYDTQGYPILFEEIFQASYTGLPESRSSIATYEYTGEPGHCRYIPDRQSFLSEEAWLEAQEELSLSPGELLHYVGGMTILDEQGHYIVSDPLFYTDRIVNRATVIANGGVLTNIGREGWYAVYTFDEAGNPVSVVTYDETDTVTGTAAFEWQLLNN